MTTKHYGNQNEPSLIEFILKNLVDPNVVEAKWFTAAKLDKALSTTSAASWSVEKLPDEQPTAATKPSAEKALDGQPTPFELEVMDALAKGGSLYYFYLEGGVALHWADEKPIRELANEGNLDALFRKLQARKAIVHVRTRGGYPYYANRVKISEYQLAK